MLQVIFWPIFLCIIFPFSPRGEWGPSVRLRRLRATPAVFNTAISASLRVLSPTSLSLFTILCHVSLGRVLFAFTRLPSGVPMLVHAMSWDFGLKTFSKHGQGIVSRKPRKPFGPIYKAIAKSLTYNYRAVLNINRDSLHTRSFSHVSRIHFFVFTDKLK